MHSVKLELCRGTFSIWPRGKGTLGYSFLKPQVTITKNTLPILVLCSKGPYAGRSEDLLYPLPFELFVINILRRLYLVQREPAKKAMRKWVNCQHNALKR